MKSDYGLGFRLPRPGCPRRCGSSWRRATRDWPSCFRRRRRFEDPVTRRTLPARRPVLPLALGAAAVATQAPRFYDDDPLAREPETQDASKVAAVGHRSVLRPGASTCSSPPGDTPSNMRAQNLNTIDEVPDSSWFTNRIGARAVPIDEACPRPQPGCAARRRARGRSSGEKTAGFAPGFTTEDAKGETWFVSFDAAEQSRRRRRRRSLVANKIFWALGYNQVENLPHRGRSEPASTSTPTATVTPAVGRAARR